MKIGVGIVETWDFFNEVFDEFKLHHEVDLFEWRTVNWPIFNTRINQTLLTRDLTQFMRNNDVVFFEWASELLVTATHLPKSSPIVTRLHRYELYRWANQVNWDAVDKVILVSESKEGEFLGRFPQMVGRTEVLPVGVSLDKFNRSGKKFSGDIGILSHLRPRKRVYDLILAFYELIQQQPSFHLHIAGGEAPGFADYYDALHRLVEKLNIQQYVTFYGHVSNQKEWLSKIDILISNSFSEGLQVSIMEAMATGIYCLSHFWEGADEMLPKENLYFSDREFREKVIEYHYLSDDERIIQKNLMCKLASQKFNLDKINVQIREVVETVGSK